MANALTQLGLTFVVLAAVLYQTFFKELLFVSFGIGRDIQSISDFPYQCRRIKDPKIQACEDMWLSEITRQLFLACSDSLSRKAWNPNIGRLNASGRGLNEAIIALDIDRPVGDGFEYRILKTPGFHGVNGDGRLHLVGLTGVDSPVSIQLYLVNGQPSIDSVTGELLDNEKIGANATIELFETGPQATSMKHLKTFANPQIAMPNNIAVVGPEKFYFTNDHGLDKVGIKHHLSPVIGGGDVSYCSSTRCERVASGFKFPNGLITGQDGRIYVPSAMAGGITVFEVQPGNALKKVDYIDIKYPLDNLVQDANGDIYAAGMPKALASVGAFEDPLNLVAPATVFRIRKKDGEDGWEVVKVLEDANGEVLPGATTALHDAKTGRIFVSGVVAPFITVCEPR